LSSGSSKTFLYSPPSIPAVVPTQISQWILGLTVV
jgi:hypothetical protein